MRCFPRLSNVLVLFFFSLPTLSKRQISIRIQRFLSLFSFSLDTRDCPSERRLSPRRWFALTDLDRPVNRRERTISQKSGGEDPSAMNVSRSDNRACREKKRERARNAECEWKFAGKREREKRTRTFESRGKQRTTVQRSEYSCSCSLIIYTSNTNTNTLFLSFSLFLSMQCIPLS